MTAAANRLPAEEVRLASHPLGHGRFRTDVSIPGMHCGGCVARVEAALTALDGVESARVNLSSRRAAVVWQDPGPPPIGPALDALGFEAHLPSGEARGGDAEQARLVRALAVAGFAAMNVMGLSVAVWSGAAPATRDMFHWISAAIALPALAYSGRIFFVSAWSIARPSRRYFSGTLPGRVSFSGSYIVAKSPGGSSGGCGEWRLTTRQSGLSFA